MLSHPGICPPRHLNHANSQGYSALLLAAGLSEETEPMLEVDNVVPGSFTASLLNQELLGEVG